MPEFTPNYALKQTRIAAEYNGKMARIFMRLCGKTHAYPSERDAIYYAQKAASYGILYMKLTGRWGDCE